MVRAIGPLSRLVVPALEAWPDRAMRGRTAGVAGSLGVTATAIGVWPLRPNGTPGWVQPVLIAVAWAGFAVAAGLVLRLPERRAVPLILAGAVVLQVAAGLGPPRSSDDAYRYIWDGRVQAAGIDPYRFAPAAPELVALRDAVLWPADAPWCVPPDAVDEATGAPLSPGCTLINRPWVHTIYPPTAQWLFRAVHAVTPAGSSPRPMQLAAGLLAVGIAVMLVAGLRQRGADPRRAVLWAWCPSVALESGGNAHVDVAAAGLTAAALLVLAAARSTRKTGAGAALLGLAIATKLTPVLVLPAVLRRRPLFVLATATGTVVLAYLPHLVSVGASVLGYLPGYLREEGYGSGFRFAVLTWLVPDAWAIAFAAGIIAVVAVAVTRLGSPDEPWHGSAIMVGTVLIVTSPAYPWYALLLVGLVALGARPEWLAVAAAGYLAQYAPEVGLASGTARQLGYGGAVLLLLVSWRVTDRLRRPATPPGGAHPPVPWMDGSARAGRRR